MAAPPPILFYIDENLSARRLAAILTDRGHRVEAVQVAAADPAILTTAEQTGAIIITGDKWFLRELYRDAGRHPARYLRAGVVLVPGEWPRAKPRIEAYLWLIEAAYASKMGREDRRIGINLATTEVRILG